MLSADVVRTGGLALRLARVIRVRPDEPATEADTIEMVGALDQS